MGIRVDGDCVAELIDEVARIPWSSSGSKTVPVERGADYSTELLRRSSHRMVAAASTSASCRRGSIRANWPRSAPTSRELTAARSAPPEGAAARSRTGGQINPLFRFGGKIRPEAATGKGCCRLRAWPSLFRGIGAKRRQALSFLATFENNHCGMNTLAVISILALLTISGAAYTDQILTSDQQTAQRAD